MQNGELGKSANSRVSRMSSRSSFAEERGIRDLEEPNHSVNPCCPLLENSKEDIGLWLQLAGGEEEGEADIFLNILNKGLRLRLRHEAFFSPSQKIFPN